MAKTLIDVDDDALTHAMAKYGTTTKVETVNRALREVTSARRAETERFMVSAVEIGRGVAERYATGDFK